MAPVKATAVGIAPQAIDDAELATLLETLNAFSIETDVEHASTHEINRLVAVVEQCSEWTFEEQVDLFEWIPALNAIDTTLRFYLKTFPNLLLVGPVDRVHKGGVEPTVPDANTATKYAATKQDADSVPESVVYAVCKLLLFISSLLRNSTNKGVFNSVEEVVDLLGAANDTVAVLALQTLSDLATPPALHKQQAPEGHQHTSNLHNSKTHSHKRLVALARGWGSRGSGLGLYACVTADNSEYGHGDLPLEAGEVRFEFFAPPSVPADNTAMEVDGKTAEASSASNNSKLVSIHLTTKDIVTVPVSSGDSMNSDKNDSQKQKRQRTMEDPQPKGMQTRPTADLFFQCLYAAGGRNRIPEDRLFFLLSDIRLAKSFHSSEARVSAVESRLLALIAILHAHPSQDIMSGYFQAQPELCVELIDLLRPTVSTGTVSAALAKPGGSNSSRLRPIEALACPPEVTYAVRNLAVEALTALVARRDGASGGLTGVARQSNILNELGVGKGMYLGLLPTLVRYSLASLTNFLTFNARRPNVEEPKMDEEEDVALDIGLAFLRATKPPTISEKDQVMRALQFVDNMLTLTSAVVSAPSGTAALTDCGIIPALLGTVALDSNTLPNALANLNADISAKDKIRIHAQVRFVASQAIQIVEGAIVTHNNALSAFHDLKGVDILIKRVQEEMVKAKEEQDEESLQAATPIETEDKADSSARKLVASRRVLLFSIVNCLTVVFHQESTSSSTPGTNGGAQLRKPELTFALTEVMQCVGSYGGVLAALTCSLLSDVMNNDPHVVYHVHKSGIAKAFFDMIAGGKETDVGVWEPAVPPVPELIMALPNVISALSLTAEGAVHVKEANPFPDVLKVLFNPKYAMPRSRCLLNEMTAIVGTGLDEVMRHVPSLRTLVMQSIVDSMNEVIRIGKALIGREVQFQSQEQDAAATDLENERTCLIQYTLNLGQMLEQILHTEDHCDPFVEAGGLTAILDLFPLLVPPTTQFLANASCLSSPSVSTLAHTTTEDSLSISFRCIAINYDSQKMLKVISKTLTSGLDTVKETQRLVRKAFPSSPSGTVKIADECAFGILDGLPRKAMYKLREQSDYVEKSKYLADFLRAVVTLQWQTNLFATVIRAASQRSQDGGTGWGRNEREWKKELSSASFEKLLRRLSEFHHSAILESCRVRSEDTFESEFKERHIKSDESEKTVRFRLRIVCQEGAVVRDGIEIDSCANIGSMEMGEVADAYERCVNSSGVMRYRTRRGWVSELTRGHGREPIAEVMDVAFVEKSKVPDDPNSRKPKRRTEYGVASFCSVGASILARLQSSHRELITCLGRVVSNGVRSLTSRAVSFEAGTVGEHTRVLLNVMLSSLSAAMNQKAIVTVFNEEEVKGPSLNRGGAAMYLASLLGIVSSSLYEDKRERRTVNVALLLALANTDRHFWSNVSPRLLDGKNEISEGLPTIGVLGSIKFVLEASLQSVASLRSESVESGRAKPVLSLNRVAAASIPPVIAILRRLVGGVAIKQSPVTSILDRLELADLVALIGGSKKEAVFNGVFCRLVDGETKFSPERFVRSVHFGVAELVLEVWKDERFRCMPAHVVHPMTTLSIEVIGGLEDAIKPSTVSSAAGTDAGDNGRSSFFGRIARETGAQREAEQPGNEEASPAFEASEEAISRLMEMGFGRDHALDAIESTGSNHLEVAMEYALSQPPPSPSTISRRREQHEERRRQREAQNGNENSDDANNDEAMEESGDGDTRNSEEAVNVSSEDARKKAVIKEEEEKEKNVVAKIKACLDDWVDSSPSVAISLIAAGPLSSSNRKQSSIVESGKGDGDAEALAVVVCSFLINLCQKYTGKTDVIVRELLGKLKSNFTEVTVGEKSAFRVFPGSELHVSALCHGAVLFARAIPRTRTRILELGLVTCIMSCLEDFASSIDQPQVNGKINWPIWLAPAILLVDVMAQPVVAFPEDGDDEETDESSNAGIHEELKVVRLEHRRKALYLSEMADTLFSALHDDKVKRSASGKSKISGSKKSSKDEAKSEAESKSESGEANKTKKKSPFSCIPPFFPLIPDEIGKTAMRFCTLLLGKECSIHKGREPPAGTVHAALLLMTRLLRSSVLAAECLKEGVPNLILALPRDCRFNGNAGLVTVILRRLLEDESNLTNAMETEIRSMLTKLHKKQNRQATSDEASAPINSFVQAMTPLLCRDPWNFLQAVMSTVSFESKSNSSGQKLVTLLSQEERQRNHSVIAAIKGQPKSSDETVEVAKKRKVTTPKTKGKTPHRSSLTKRGGSAKKGKKEKCDSGLNGTPPNHIMSLLIEKMIALSYPIKETGSDDRSSFGQDSSFLWVADILHIMADLVLAVPACAAAIHRFRPMSSKGQHLNCHVLTKLSHALAGCPAPQPTVVGFLLHSLLPQDRWSYRRDQDIWDRRDQRDEGRKQKNKESYMQTKLAQTTARLLVALVARAGEGRRRVVAELSFALSGGRQKAGTNAVGARGPSNASGADNVELFALQAWGDLCIGLAAPRSNGVNHDNNANLSYEVVKLMLEFKMAHSLIYAVGFVDLKHPMAASACGSLLVPLEVFTRPSVTDAVQVLADKEEADRVKVLKASESVAANKGEKKEKLRGMSRGASLGASQRRESFFADDSMLADGFDVEAAGARNRHTDDDSGDDDDDDDDDEVVMEVMEDDDVVIDEDVDMEDQSEDDDVESEEEDDDEGDSDSEDESGDDNDSNDEDEEIEDDEEEEIEDNMEPNVGHFMEEMGEFLDDEEDEEAEEAEQGRSENDLDDWDQIEAPPFGGMILGGRRRGGGNLSSRARGFVDAAEAMIGSLLRTGEIQGDALAEIEGTLGIRIGGNRNGSDWNGGGRIFGSPSDGRPGQRQSNNHNAIDGGVLGTVPYVNQRRPPDVGYSGPGGGGRWNDISSMEFVFGGPTLTGGSRNFDVVSDIEPRGNDEMYALPSAVDSQLFPGGPAASTHARTQQAFHPLLCGVDLPPVNSLVSDLLPHGERSTRRGEINTRRGDGWTGLSVSAGTGGYMVSTPNGNLMRVSRGGAQPQTSGRGSNLGLIGWTDDGQPYDGTAGNFSSAFEAAINETLEQQNETIQAQVNADAELARQAAEDVESGVERTEDADPVIEGEATEDTGGAGEVQVENMDEEAEVEPPASEELAEPMSDIGTLQPSANLDHNENSAVPSGDVFVAQLENHPESATQPSGSTNDVATTNDGDGVASSLVNGLSLSDRESTGASSNHDESAERIEEIGTSPSTAGVNGDEIAALAGDTEPSPVAPEEPSVTTGNEPNANGLVCPPGMDLEVFNSLPMDMQREVVDQHRSTMELAAQLDSTSGLDPEALAALPEDMRREVIAQEQRERRLRESAPADPSNAEDMDNASFVVSLAPELRREILLTADETFLNSLPPDIIAEAQLLRERASHQHRRLQDPVQGETGGDDIRPEGNRAQGAEAVHSTATNSRKKPRHGKLKVDCDRCPVLYVSGLDPSFSTEPFGSDEVKSLVQLMFLLSPVRPQRLLQKVFQNISTHSALRCVVSSAFTRLLNDDSSGTAAAIDSLKKAGEKQDDSEDSNFPPRSLIGAAPEVLDSGSMDPTAAMFFRRRQGSSCAASIAASLPTTLRGASNRRHMPPVVATRVIDTLSYLGKNSPRVCLDMLTNSMLGVEALDENETGTCFEQILDLLRKPRYVKSSTNLEHLLAMIEIIILPLASLSRNEEDDTEVLPKDVEAAAATGKEWVEIPRIVISQSRLQLLCSILKMESCKDASFTKVNGITRRLCKVEANRGHVLGELASVAQALGEDAKRDLRSLLVRMNDAVTVQQNALKKTEGKGGTSEANESVANPSSTVTLSSSSSELKLLRVLQTLQSLCSESPTEDGSRRKNDGKFFVTAELIEILQGINLNELWNQLSSCLKVVRVLEGISTVDEIYEKTGDNDEEMEDNGGGNDGTEDNVEEGSESVMNSAKKLQNSSAGLLTRFLPAIEAFFVVSASATREEETESATKPTLNDKAVVTPNSLASIDRKESKAEPDGSTLVGGSLVVDFVSENRVILNALVRNNAGLLEKGLKAMVQVPRCRGYLDFDVKRQWFKTQIRRLRQQASRRHGSLRLGIRRKHVFEDAYHQLRLRNADEMRSRLHITFKNEEGVDAGGLSREFFGILAKEMFNPNYALFTSTEDGCTFQPNSNSSINPDHLSYFRFVGRIVGKAVADGFLLDAHFTRSLYKHMLGLEPTHHDMEAIDPDYYKNLKMIMEYSLVDIGLELTFSIEDHSFGRNQSIDLIPDGRNVPVTDDTKAKYVSLVCKHRMTTAIKSQIKAYLDGFYELISPELIAIFTPRELELLISGLPDIDIDDLKKNTDYQGWKATDPEIEWFWSVMFSLTRSEKASFLQFVTGSSKVPLAGFSELQGMRGVQKFSIHKAGGPSGSLMSAHTCFNSLDLPKYESEDEMKEKLRYAISEGQGSFQFA